VGFGLQSKNVSDVSYRADATVSDLNLERLGEQFKVPALATERYKSTINAHVTANGAGTDPKAMRVIAAGAITNSTILGGRIPNLTFDADVAQDTAHVKADVAFADFDPALASGKPAMKGTIGGTVSVDATVTGVSTGVTPDSIEGSAKLALQPSTVGGLGIDRAKVDATVTGNKHELQAAGNITGDGVKYGDNGALTISSNFSATVPQLRAQEASVHATTHATFVTVGGQNINELDAQTDYGGNAAS